LIDLATIPSRIARLDMNAIERKRTTESLHAFVRAAWHVVEPTSPFVDGRHIHAICEALEACESGQIRQLLINIPPRFAKSLLVSVFFPAWCWARKPESRFLFMSYAQTLSTRDSRKTRQIIQSDWYQGLWGDQVILASDQNQIMRFENTRSGYRIASSIRGTGTGEGGDFVGVDDPHSADQAASDIEREGALTWWDETMSTRQNDPKTGCRIIVMQRLHQRDLSGHVLAQGGYVHLCLPMEFDPRRKCVVDIPGFKFEDWRKEEGELLWPERFGPEEVIQLKKELRTYGTAGQLQQEPAPRGGGMFKRAWFGTVDHKPEGLSWMRYWDLAGTAESAINPDPDYTAGALVGVGEERVVIADLQHFRGTDHEIGNRIEQTAQADGPEVPIAIEQEPGSSGKSLIDHYIRRLIGYNVRGHRPTGQKENRWGPFAGLAAAGGVSLVRGGWIQDFLSEVEVAPAGAHDDQLDAVVGALSLLSSGEDRRIFKMLDPIHMMLDQPKIMPMREGWGLVVPGYINKDGDDVIRPVGLVRAIVQGTGGVCGCVWAAVDEDFDWSVYRVYKQTGWGAGENAREINRLSGKEFFRYDLINSIEAAPGNWGRSEDQFASYTDEQGEQPLCSLEPVKFSGQDRQEGLAAVRALLLSTLAIEAVDHAWWGESGQDRDTVISMRQDSGMFISPACRGLFDELATMKYKPAAGAEAGGRPTERASGDEVTPLVDCLRMLTQATMGDLIRRRSA